MSTGPTCCTTTIEKQPAWKSTAITFLLPNFSASPDTIFCKSGCHPPGCSICTESKTWGGLSSRMQLYLQWEECTDPGTKGQEQECLPFYHLLIPSNDSKGTFHFWLHNCGLCRVRAPGPQSGCTLAREQIQSSIEHKVKAAFQGTLGSLSPETSKWEEKSPSWQE